MTSPSDIPGVFEIKVPCFSDHRGSFFNFYRTDSELTSTSWGTRAVNQINISVTTAIGSIRGLHFQQSPYADAKFITSTLGRVWDVVVDLRPNSPTFKSWRSCILDSSIGNAILIPEGCAHGFQVLESNSHLLYMHSNVWAPEFESGFRFDDPSFAIDWPLPPVQLSERDLSLPFYN